DAWQLAGFSGDAVRYHHEPGAQVLDAHHLVKIINLASLFSAPGPVSDEAIEQADVLFGLNEGLTRELRERISADVERIAGGLNIDISSDDGDSAAQQLGERLGQLSQLGQMNGELWREQSRAALDQTIRRIIFMTLGIEQTFLFTLDTEQQALAAYARPPYIEPDAPAGPDFIVPLLPNRSLVSDALLQQQPLHSADTPSHGLAVVDRQLLKLCGTRQLLCLPLNHEGAPIGVLVLGIDNDDPQTSKPILLAGLCSEIAAAVQHRRSQLRDSDSLPDTNTELQQKTRARVHEASNPPSIIRTYLEMLRLKLGEEHQARDDLELIKQEIDRVGIILLRLREPAAVSDEPGDVVLNALVTTTARIFDQSLCATHQITLQLQLEKSLPPLHANATHLQQMLTNL